MEVLRRLQFTSLLVIPNLTTSGAIYCNRPAVKEVISSCNGLLSRIHIYVLSEQHQNYSLTCWAFEDYVRCMEPNLGICADKRFVLIRRYEAEKSKYIQGPYNCTLPRVNYKKRATNNTPSTAVASLCFPDTSMILSFAVIAFTAALLKHIGILELREFCKSVAHGC